MNNNDNKPKRGRPKGSRNKVNWELKELVRKSLGGEAEAIKYLRKLRDRNPMVFGSLLAKLIPKEVSAQIQHEGLSITVVSGIEAPAPSEQANAPGNGRPRV